MWSFASGGCSASAPRALGRSWQANDSVSEASPRLAARLHTVVSRIATFADARAATAAEKHGWKYWNNIILSKLLRCRFRTSEFTRCPASYIDAQGRAHDDVMPRHDGVGYKPKRLSAAAMLHRQILSDIACIAHVKHASGKCLNMDTYKRAQHARSSPTASTRMCQAEYAPPCPTAGRSNISLSIIIFFFRFIITIISPRCYSPGNTQEVSYVACMNCRGAMAVT